MSPEQQGKLSVLMVRKAKDMSTSLNESELTERRAFIESFVKEIAVAPGKASIRYAIQMPENVGFRDRKQGGWLYADGFCLQSG